ncbi:MAG: dynamin family protein [Bacteroidales bacterium]|nr:dynamin family protein [Bacteroidales bacterium]
MEQFDDTPKKLKDLNELLTNTEKFIKICETDGFRDHYPYKEEEWNYGFQNIVTELNDVITLLFIGPFSSGKSTFVNALIGKDILPTNDSPCTAVITEIQFKKSGDHTAKIYRKGEDKPDEREFSEVINIINGPTGAVGEVASYHHIVLELDTELLEDRYYEQFVGKVKIVDCPGYGSKYYSNEDIIASYMQSSNFTFWMTPAQKIGGEVAKKYLSEIKRKTQTLIPVITKSDTISDEKEREEIRESFVKELGDLFKLKEVQFVSSLKWQESRSLQKQLDNKKEKLSTDKVQELITKIKTLKNDSGVVNVILQMMDSVDKKGINVAKIGSCKSALTELLKDIKKVADDELKRWQTDLSASGIDIQNLDNKYGKIDTVKKDVDKWIKDNVKDFSDSLNNNIINELSKCKQPTQNTINDIINRVLQIEQPKINTKLKDKLQKSYKQFLGDYKLSAEDIEQLNFGGISLEEFKRVLEPVKNVLFAMLETLKTAGVQSVLTGASGVGLWMWAPAIAEHVLVPAFVGTIASVAGAALIGLAIIPLIPTIADKIKNINKRSEEERENELRNTLLTGFNDKILPSLTKTMYEVSDNYYKSIISQVDQTNGKKEQNYKIVASVIANVNEKIDFINKNL